MKLARALLPLFIGLIAACAVLLLLQVNLSWAVIETQTQTTIDDFNRGVFFRTGMTSDDDGEVTLLRQGVAGEWITTTVPTGLVPRYGHAAVIYNNRYYVIGGRNAQSSLRSVQYSLINTTTHALGVWTTTTSLPTSIYTYTTGAFSGLTYPSAAELHGRIYLAGGEGGESSSQVYRYPAVVYATPNMTGDLSAWTATTPLPQPLSHGQLVALNDYLYYVGGRTNPSGQGTNTVYYAKPDPLTGAISQWFTATTAIPYRPYGHMAVATQNGHLYVISGIDQSGFTGGVPYVYYAHPLSDTGNITGWFHTVDLPRSITDGAGVYYGGQFYLTGGFLDANFSILSDLVFAAFEEDAGGVITWTSTSAIDPARALHTALANQADGWLYVVGGSSGSVEPIASGIINIGATTGEGGSEYARTGVYRSADFDLVKSYQILNLNWTAYLSDPAEMTLTLRYRTRQRINEPYSAWSAWLPSDPVSGIATTVVSTSLAARYLQYEAFFSTTNTAKTPILYQVTLTYDIPKPPKFEKSANPASGNSVKSGDRITYTLRFTNTSGGLQTQVIIADVIPAGTTYVPGSIFASAGITPTVLANSVAWDAGTVPVDGTGEMGFVVTVDAGLPDGTVIQNVGSYDSNTIILTSNTSHYIGKPPRIFKSHAISGPAAVQPGDQINYTLVYSNPGANNLSGTVITDTLPPELSFVSGTPAPEDLGNGVIRWLIGSVPADSDGSVSFVAQVTTAAVDGGVIQNVAQLGADQRQTVESDVDKVDVRYRYDLQMSQTVDKLKAPPGGLLNYTFLLTNVTQVDLTPANIVVSVYLAPGLPGLTRTHALDCVAPCSGWNFGGMDVDGYLIYTQTIAALGPNQTTQLSMQTLISATLPEDVLAVAAYSDALDDGQRGIDIDFSNQSGSSITTVGGPDIEVTQLKSPAFAVQEKNFTVQALVANTGFAATRGPDNTGWFGVDLYVKPIGSARPTGPGDRYLGACPTTVNPCPPPALREAYYKGVPDPNNLNTALPVSGVVTLTYQISVPVKGTYWLYLQADTYWNDPGQSWVGTAEHGRVVEGNEVNNIYGPFEITIGEYNIYLPIMRR